MTNRLIQASIALAGMTLAGTAMAHPGHDSGLLAGILHPLSGIDHALAMLAIGLWSYRLGGKARLLVPAGFLVLMALGGLLAFAGLPLPFGEHGIATSLLLLGLLLAFAIRLPVAAAVAVAGVFAVFHGHAHGIEIPLPGAQWTYGAGFILATASLHCAGLAAAAVLGKRQPMLRAAGAAIAATGVWLLAGAAG